MISLQNKIRKSREAEALMKKHFSKQNMMRNASHVRDDSVLIEPSDSDHETSPGNVSELPPLHHDSSQPYPSFIHAAIDHNRMSI